MGTECPCVRERDDAEARRKYLDATLKRIYESCETPEDFVSFDEMQQGKCEGWEGPCGKPGTLFHMHTAYHKAISNFRCLCDDCQKLSDEYWDERWREYYSGLL